MKTILFYVMLLVLALLVPAGIVSVFGFDMAKWVLIGLALLFLGHFGILVLQKGWGWVLAKYHAWVSAAKTDLSDITGDVSSLKSRVTALEQKVLGALHATPVAAAPAAPAPVAAAPAVQPAVQQSPNSNG